MSDNYIKDMKNISSNFNGSDLLDDLKEVSEFGSDLIEAEIFDDNNKASSFVSQKIFEGITDHSDVEDAEVLEILKHGKVPEKKIVKRLKATNLGINLAQLALAKKLAGKLGIIENYLSKLEDKLFDDKNIEVMTMEDTMALYSSTRILFEKSNDMLMKIKNTIDIDAIEMDIKSIGASEDNDVSLNNTEDLDEIMNFIKDRKSNGK